MFHLDKKLKNTQNIELYRLSDWSGVRILKEDYIETCNIFETSDVKLCERNNVQYIFGTTNNATDTHWRGYRLLQPYNNEICLICMNFIKVMDNLFFNCILKFS